MTFEDFIAERAARLADGRHSTDDVLVGFLPLLRETIAAHRAGLAAPLEGTSELRVAVTSGGERLYFEEAKRIAPRFKPIELARLAMADAAAIEILDEARLDRLGDTDAFARLEIGVRGEPISRPVYLPGYVAWEHEIGCHDPLTDAFSLGLILASIACGLNLNEPDELARFVEHRRNLFVLHPRLHPVVVQTITKLAQLDRRKRPQDLSEVLSLLENYREAPVELAVDLARSAGFHTRDRQTRNEIVLSKLKERLFDLTRRNNLLHFRPTMQSVNLTHASIPLLFDPRHIREDQILVWSDKLQAQLVSGKPIPLAKHLNFAEALYLPSLLDRIIAEARRDHQEYGFAQLRLVACFLSWTNLKETPVERFISPLVLIPVKLAKSRGIRDTYSLEGLSNEAEINPVIRHQFKRLYNIDLPETIDLSAANLDELFELLAAKIRVSEPAIELQKIDRPRIDLVHERAKRRLEQYRRSARIAGRGVKSYLDLDYSYSPANFHPLGVKLFSSLVKTPGSHLRDLVETTPRPRAFASGAGPAVETKETEAPLERTFYRLRGADDANPYVWSYDLCSLTVTNLRYRRMSLVRDYEAILDRKLVSPSFEATFSLSARSVDGAPPIAPPLEERHDVVPCDPTQATAIAEARRGSSYIIQGPPGTGKSQTITNLIADFVARGKRVLFVCEKRAAIDVVFARLSQCGLASLCSLIHDSQADKREFILDLKQAYEEWMARMSHPATVRAGGKKSAEPVSPRTGLLAQMNKDLAPLVEFDETMNRTDDLGGVSWRRFLDRRIRRQENDPDLSPDEERLLPTFREWHYCRDALADLSPRLADFAPDGALGLHPLRWLRPELASAERPADLVREAAPRARRALESLVEALRASQAPGECWQTFARAEELIAYAKTAAPLAPGGNLSLAEAHSKRAKEWTKAKRSLEAHESALAEARAATAAWREKLPASELAAALDQARRWDGKPLVRLNPAWWRLRKALHVCYDFSAHRIRPSWVQVLEGLQREYAAEETLAKARADVKTAFGGSLEADELERAIDALYDRTRRLSAALQRLHAALVNSPQAESMVGAARSAEPLASDCRRELTALLVDFETLPLAELGKELLAIGAAASEAPLALPVLAELRSLPEAVGRAVRRLPHSLAAIEAAVCRCTWDEAKRGSLALQRFDGRLKSACAERLAERYRQWLAANAAEIREAVGRRFQEHVRRSSATGAQLSAEQLEFKKSYQQGRRLLEHEFGKSMRYKSIRELVDGDAGQVIRDLKPVWLMSPLSVSDTLPLESELFDVVIFDEASQATLEESTPTLFRGRQTIVVGDEMQLPPTDFFAAKSSESEESADESAADGEIRREISSDSLLNHAARNLPSTMLGWHYRSRSESLISFSNWAFYDGRLLTVPDCLAIEAAGDALDASLDSKTDSAIERLLAQPVTFHHLPTSIYENRRNRGEAEQIAILVRDLLARELGLSIGVIAFSEAQQGEIEAALARLAADDDDFRRRLEEEQQKEVDGQFVGLLVKNLENIQGDERDVILLSVCYGPNAEGKMQMNFGPINKTGGEKRLNVAFSRAKRHMGVVSTIRYSQITNEFNEGAGCLRSYLRYAEALSQGDAEGAERVLASISRWKESTEPGDFGEGDDATAEQLAEALRERGFLVERSIGHSHFRVDLAVRRAGDDRHRLGVLIDTPLLYEQSEPLERDVMRPELLREFGWRIESVLAKDWCEFRDRELARILAALA